MTESEIREFVAEATMTTGDSVTVTESIVTRWLEDRQVAVEEKVEAIDLDARDSWDGS
jgi:hypothetical protein